MSLRNSENMHYIGDTVIDQGIARVRTLLYGGKCLLDRTLNLEYQHQLWRQRRNAGVGS